jgi:hypothetical protein
VWSTAAPARSAPAVVVPLDNIGTGARPSSPDVTKVVHAARRARLTTARRPDRPCLLHGLLSASQEGPGEPRQAWLRRNVLCVESRSVPSSSKAEARRGRVLRVGPTAPVSSETGVSLAPVATPATEAAAARLAVDPQWALLPVASRVCTETLAKLVQERYRRVPRAIAIRPADEALVRRHRAAARRLQARQGGRRAPPRRRPSTAHELPRLRRPRAALQLLPASFRVGTPRPRVVPGMSDDGRAIAPQLTAPHA